jgi:DNA end-binding protein Ku
MYHADEVRDFQQVPKGEKVNVSEKELELGIGLIDRLTSEEFNPENYKDEYRIRVLAMLDEKSKGKEIIISPPAPQRGGKVVNIMKALKSSMERNPAKKKPATTAAAKKKRPFPSFFTHSHAPLLVALTRLSCLKSKTA